MKKISLFIVMFSILFATGAHSVDATEHVNSSNTNTSSTAQVSAGLIPGNFFYFLDRWGEGVQEFFTFKSESKARLHLQFAEERIAEIDKVLESEDRDVEELKIAEERLQHNISRATSFLDKEKLKGNDISELAIELTDTLFEHRQEAKLVFRNAQDIIRNDIESLYDELDIAVENDDEVLQDELLDEIDRIKDFQVEIDEERLHTLESIFDEKERLYDELDEVHRIEQELRDAAEHDIEIDEKFIEDRILRELQIRGEKFDFIGPIENIEEFDLDEVHEVVEKVRDILHEIEIDEPRPNFDTHESDVHVEISPETAVIFDIDFEDIELIEDTLSDLELFDTTFDSADLQFDF